MKEMICGKTRKGYALIMVLGITTLALLILESITGAADTGNDSAISQNATFWYNKGVALDSMSKYNESIQAYDKVIEIDPNYFNAWYNKGVVLDNWGKYEEAVQVYAKAIEINPKDSDAWHNKGIALDKLGRHEKAVVCYNKAKEVNTTTIFPLENNTTTIV